MGKTVNLYIIFFPWFNNLQQRTRPYYKHMVIPKHQAVRLRKPGNVSEMYGFLNRYYIDTDLGMVPMSGGNFTLPTKEIKRWGPTLKKAGKFICACVK